MHHNFILKKTISSTAVAKQWPSQYEVGQEEGVFCTEAHTAWKSSRQDYDPNEYPSRSESIGELVNQTPYRNSSPDLSLYNPQGSGRVGLFGIKKKKKRNSTVVCHLNPCVVSERHQNLLVTFLLFYATIVLFVRFQTTFAVSSRSHPPRNTTSCFLVPYLSYIGYVAPHRVGFLRRFGLKAGIRFAHFGLESDIVLFSRGLSNTPAL